MIRNLRIIANKKQFLVSIIFFNPILLDTICECIKAKKLIRLSCRPPGYNHNTLICEKSDKVLFFPLLNFKCT